MKRIFLVGASSLVVAGLPLLGVSGCNVLVSAGDYHVVPDDATAGDGGIPDTNPGRPDTNIGVDAADAADAPDTTPSPVCGQGLPTSDPTFQQVVRACVLQAGCDPRGVPSWTLSQCVSQHYLGGIPGVASLANAATCADVAAVTGQDYTTSECTNLSDGDHCGTGAALNKALTCKGGFGSYKDCTKIGGAGATCGTYLNAAGATVADCVVKPSCTPQDGGACDGNNLYFCHNGQGYGESCTAINAVCSASATPSTCYYKGDISGCTTLGATCKNDVIEACYGGSGVPNTLYHFDCKVAGLKCTQDTSTTAYCTAPGCSVAQMTACKESCKDTKTATFCVGGAPLDVDCTKYGFTACDVFGTKKQVSCY